MIMRRAHRHSDGHGVGGVMSDASAVVIAAKEAACTEPQKFISADRNLSSDAGYCHGSANDAAGQATLLERLWRRVDHLISDISYTIEERFIIPQKISAMLGLIEEEVTHRRSFLVLVGHFISIVIVMVIAAYSRRLSHLMSGVSPVVGEILFCASHLSQVTQEQLGWSLFCSGFLSSSTRDWAVVEGGVSGGVVMSNGAAGHGSKRQMLGAIGGGGIGANGALAGGSQGWAGMGSGGAGGMMVCPNTGGSLVRYLLGRKANNMIRHEPLRSYLYSSFYSPSAFLVEQTAWFVLLATTMDVVTMQRLAVAVFFANVVGWLPVYSVKLLARLGTALAVVFIFLIPFYEVDDTVTSTLVHHSVYHVLSAYCASLCITLLFAETLLFDDVRRVLVQGVVTLPQRLLRVAGHLSVVTKLVRGCMWLRCEYLYFVDFYFFLGIMCWLSLVMMETGAGISVFATAALVITVPSLVGNGWMATPKRALKDTVIYVGFYVVTALLLFHLVPWSGLAFLSNAVQSAAVLLLMAARCEYKQPGGSAYLILWVTMMCVYMYLKSSATRGMSRSLVWATNNSNSRANFEKVTHAVWYGVPEVEGAVFDLLRIVFIAFWQFLFEGLSEEGVQLLHFNVVVFGSMLLLSTAVRAVVVEGVRFSSPGQWVLPSAEATSTPAAASTPTSATVAAIKGEHNVGAAQVFPGRDSSSSSSRGVSNALSCSAPAPSSFAKSKSTQPCGGAKASSLSTASSARRSWQAPSRTAAADGNTYVGGAGRGGAATPGVAGSEETVTDTRVALIKTTNEGKEAAREVESVPRGGGEKSTSPASSAAMDEFLTEDERAPAALEGGAVTSRTPQTSECDAQKSKGGGDPKKQSFRPVTVSVAQNRCSAETVDETAAQKRTHPQPICTLDKSSEMVARVFQRDASNIFKETSRSASLEESMNYNATVLTSSMCRSDVSSTTPFSLHHEHSTCFTSRSSTTVEILWEARRERHEGEPEKVPLREQERPKTPSSTTSGALSTPHSMTTTECEGEEQRRQTSKSSLKQKKTPETGTMTCSSQGTVLPLPRSRVEELKVPGVHMTGPSANSRQSDVTEGKEAVRGKKAVADARAPGASAGKAASLTALTVSADSASPAVVIETGPKDDRGKAARANSEGKKADGKVKAAVGKNAKSKAATESPAGDEKVVAPTVTQWPAPFPLPKPRHEQTAAAEASATVIVKAPAAAGKSTPGLTANGEKRGKKATVPTMSNKEGVMNTRKAAAAAPERTQTLAGAAAATASSSQSVMAAPAVLPVPLPRSAQVADAEGTVQSAQTPAESGELALEEPVQRPWRDARLANAVSRLSPAVETDGPAWKPASEPKQEVKGKHSAALTADDGEEPDDGYDLDGVLSFLRLKVDYSSVMDDEEDRSNSVSSNADDRHNPTSFRHFESPEDSTVAVQTPLTNSHVVKCGLSGSTDLGVPANVFSTVPQPHDCVNSAHGSLALAQPSRSESLMESSQDTFQAIQSAPEWTAKGRSSFGDLCTNSVASANNNITNASGKYVPNGASSPGFHVFSIHPTATGISTAASSSLSPQPQSVHMGIASHGSAPLFPVAMESCMESSVTAHHIDFNAAGTSLGYYQVPQVAVPPSPPMDSRQSSSSHMPFSISTVNLSASPMSSLSSLGRTNTDTGIDQNGVLSRLHVVPNSRMAMSEQMAMQQSPQTMMVMMRTPDGQMGLYPMVYNQPMPLLDASGLMQQTQRAQVTAQQQQPVYASAPLLQGHSGMVGYQIAPDGSYVMTTTSEVLQQTMNQHQQHQEPHQRFCYD